MSNLGFFEWVLVGLLGAALLSSLYKLIARRRVLHPSHPPRTSDARGETALCIFTVAIEPHEKYGTNLQEVAELLLRDMECCARAQGLSFAERADWKATLHTKWGSRGVVSLFVPMRCTIERFQPFSGAAYACARRYGSFFPPDQK